MKLTKEMLYTGTVFHCDTEEKANELLSKLHELGFSWKCGQSLMSEDNCYYINRINNCYEIYSDKTTSYGGYDFYFKNNYKIIEYVLDKDEENPAMTNGEYYKKEIAKFWIGYFGVDKETKKIKCCHNTKCGNCLFSGYEDGCGNERNKWYFSQHKEEPILNETEKAYLEDVIRPFKNRAKKIVLSSFSSSLNYISIIIEEEKDYISFPNFETGTMYKDMELEKEYTLEELGLFEEDEDHEL